MDDLEQLLRIISEQGNAILQRCRRDGVKFPSLNEPFDESTEKTRNLPEVAHAVDLLAAAAKQLIATVLPPVPAVYATSLSWTVPVCLNVIAETNVVEILESAGGKGLHVDEISKKTTVEAGKLGRVLRLLATYHYFREVEPNVFANNKLSSVISTSKNPKLLLADPKHKHDNTTGTSALVGLLTGWNMKSSSHFLEHLTDQETSHSQEPSDSSFKRAYGMTVFEWMGKPEQQLERKNFDIAMAGSNFLHPPEGVIQAFDWGALPPNSVVVDVGGGVGSVSLEIIKNFPSLRCIVQDRAEVINEGERWLQDRFPQALKSKQISYEGHDFFKPQPPRQNAPSVYLMRLITHNWSDLYLKRILDGLRAGADRKTSLLIQDNVLTYACPDPLTTSHQIEGSDIVAPPPPLLYNLGKPFPYESDILMLNHFNAKERTLKDFQDLLAASGWKLVRMHQFDAAGGQYPLITAVPVYSENGVNGLNGVNGVH